MSANEINNLRPNEKKIIKKYEIVAGRVMAIYELMIKDIDTNEFHIAEKAMAPTGMTKEDYISHLETKRDEIIEIKQIEIDKVKAIE